jgi:hypothetical protein
MGATMSSRLKNLHTKFLNTLWIRHPDPELEAGEQVMLTGRAILFASVLGARVGSVKLTNHRIICNEGARGWPFRPTYWEERLSNISSVDEGGVAERLVFFRGFRLRLRGGKDKLVALTGGDRKRWITAIRKHLAASSAQSASD